jgi:hypothetical protein
MTQIMSRRPLVKKRNNEFEKREWLNGNYREKRKTIIFLLPHADCSRPGVR